MVIVSANHSKSFSHPACDKPGRGWGGVSSGFVLKRHETGDPGNVKEFVRRHYMMLARCDI